MAYAYVKKVYAGTNVITLPFSYLSTNDVYLWVNDVLRPQSEITWTSSSIVTITTSGLTTGDVILIARVTNIASSNVVYSNDTQLTKDNLNNANKQLLYLNQETRDVTTLANATVVGEAQTAADTAVAAAVAAEASADEAAATVALLTPENILAVVKTVDGTGSGLDADRLDGSHSTAFATAAQGTKADAALPATSYTASDVLTKIKTVDGTGSGLDADTLDGIHATDIVDYLADAYAPLSHVSATAAPHGATSTNTASRIVTRDASGNFTAGTVTAALTGNASTATTLATTRTLNVSGDVTGTAQNFNGSANVSIPTTLAASTVLSKLVTVDGTGSGLDADLLDGNEATAFATSGHTHTVYQNKIPAGTCATAIGTAAKVVTITDYTPAVGDVIAITFTSGNSAAAMTLNINSIGAYAIRMNNIATTTAFATLAAGAVILLYWDGTYFQMLGSQDPFDADTTDRMLWSIAVTAGITLYSYKMMMQGADGKFYPLTLEDGTGTTKTVSTVEFNIGSPVLYYNSTTTVATNASASPVYSEYHITNLTYTFNQATWTAQLPIYLKGTITAGGRFKLDNTSYTSWATQTLPTTEDGFVYMLLGHAYTTTAMRLSESHPLIEYKGSKLRTYIADGVASGLNADKLDGYHIDDIATYVASSFAPVSHVSDTAAHGAVSTNTASKIVTRDASGNFAAGTISANLTGTATSSTYASQLLTSRTFNVSGDITGTATSFNGTANITIPATLTKVRAGTHAFRRLGNSGGTDNITITAANGTATISFSVSSYAIGSGSAAALFTAPITGLYHFDACLRFLTTTNAATGLACGLQTPTNLFYGTCPIPDGTLTGDLFTRNVSIDEYLTAGGTVSVSALKLGAGSCVVDVGASWWSGHLVYAA